MREIKSSQAEETFDPRPLARCLFDGGILAAVLVAMNGLLALQLRPKDLLEWVGAGIVAMAAARLPHCWRRRSGKTALLFLCLALALLTGLAWLAAHRLGGAVSFHRAWFAGGAMLMITTVAGLVSVSPLARFSEGVEGFRLLAVIFGAGWVYAPFLTPQMLGGLDAHWYGHIMVDALQQAHAGIFPVFVGQGEFMFNGAVHPYRTAPYHHHFGILLDAVTFRALTPLAVQHLTVVVTAVWSAVLTYLCLNALAPGRRWLACALALGYVSGPAIAGAIYAQEMYMTFTAYGWLPLVLYSNVRLVRENDLAGWLLLAAGLAFVWMCHAPVGAFASLVTVGIQGVRLIARDFDFRSWGLAVVGGAVFAALTSYYFFSISELSPANARGTEALVTYGGGALVGLGALVRLIATAQWRWLVAGGLALGVLWPTHRMYFGWLAGAFVFAALFVALDRWITRFRTRRAGLPTSSVTYYVTRGHVPELVALALFFGGLAASFYFPEQDGARIIRSDQAYRLMAELFPKNLSSVSWLAQQLGDLQPGYAVLAGLGAGLLALFARPTWEVKLVTLAGCVLCLLLFPVPKITLLLYRAIPDPLYGICSVSLWLRLMPMLMTTGIFAGFLALSSAPRGFGMNLAVMLGAIELLVAHWAETSRFRYLGMRAVNVPERTAMFYRTENAQLYSYAYNGLPHPSTMLNGVTDYHLESRLLDVEKRSWRPDPVFEIGFFAPVDLVPTPGPEGMAWSWFEPRFPVGVDERQLFKFEFVDRTYSGTLVMKSPGFYRDYYLPDAGFYANSFGSAPTKPKTLAVWNSGPEARSVQLAYVNADPEQYGKPLGNFARVRVRPYRTEELQIQTRRLIPYRADVELKEPMYLETPHVYIPGYKARVDGISRKIEISPDRLAMVRVEPGHHTIDLFYTGTFAARMMLRFCATCWLVLAGYGVWRWRVGRVILNPPPLM